VAIVDKLLAQYTFPKKNGSFILSSMVILSWRIYEILEIPSISMANKKNYPANFLISGYNWDFTHADR
jgi:hypothetical protein